MFKILTGLAALLLISTPAMAKDRSVETIGGAVVGGIIGNEVGGRDGAILGAIGGGILANQITKSIDKKNERRARRYYGPPHRFAPYPMYDRHCFKKGKRRGHCRYR